MFNFEAKVPVITGAASAIDAAAAAKRAAVRARLRLTDINAIGQAQTAADLALPATDVIALTSEVSIRATVNPWAPPQYSISDARTFTSTTLAWGHSAM